MPTLPTLDPNYAKTQRTIKGLAKRCTAPPSWAAAARMSGVLPGRMGLWCIAFAIICSALVLTALPAAAQGFQLFVPSIATDNKGPGGSGSEECPLPDDDEDCEGNEQQDQDDDNDDVINSDDNCLLIANPDQADLDNDEQGDVCDADDDSDQIEDTIDNCPLIANPTQSDGDGDGRGDSCDDTDDDDDTIKNDRDNCLLVANPDQSDNDFDNLGDACDDDNDNDYLKDDSDNCPLVANPDQANTDGDSQGDACDEDDDGDGVEDNTDNCSLLPNSGQENTDGDGQGNSCDADDDGDGLEDSNDNCPLVGNPGQTDTDGDSVGDACERNHGGPGGVGEEPKPSKCNLNEQEAAIETLILSYPEQGRNNPVCDPILAEVARARARDMALRDYFSHINPDGDGPNLLVREAGYPLPDWYATEQDANNIESIGGGYSTAEDVWNAWLNSPPHHTQVVGTEEFFSSQESYGVGYFFNEDAEYEHYWVFISAPTAD